MPSRLNPSSSKREVALVCFLSLLYFGTSFAAFYAYFTFSNFKFNSIYVWMGSSVSGVLFTFGMLISPFFRCCIKVTIIHCGSGWGLVSVYMLLSWIFCVEYISSANQVAESLIRATAHVESTQESQLMNVQFVHKLIPVPIFISFIYSVYFVHSKKNPKVKNTAKKRECMVSDAFKNYALGLALGFIIGVVIFLYLQFITLFEGAIVGGKSISVRLSWFSALYFVLSIVVLILITLTDKTYNVKLQTIRKCYPGLSNSTPSKTPEVPNPTDPEENSNEHESSNQESSSSERPTNSKNKFRANKLREDSLPLELRNPKERQILYKKPTDTPSWKTSEVMKSSTNTFKVFDP